MAKAKAKGKGSGKAEVTETKPVASQLPEDAEDTLALKV